MYNEITKWYTKGPDDIMENIDAEYRDIRTVSKIDDCVLKYQKSDGFNTIKYHKESLALLMWYLLVTSLILCSCSSGNVYVYIAEFVLLMFIQCNKMAISEDYAIMQEKLHLIPDMKSPWIYWLGKHHSMCLFHKATVPGKMVFE